MRKDGMVRFSFLILIVPSMLLLTGCIDTDSSSSNEFIPPEPVVRATDVTYDHNGVIDTFWGLTIHDSFGDIYTPGSFSMEILNETIEMMKFKAQEIGEDPVELETSLLATGRVGIEGHIPCFAEKAQYQYFEKQRGMDEVDMMDDVREDIGPLVTEECWIFVNNWGAPQENLTHIEIFVVSTIDHSVIFDAHCD